MIDKSLRGLERLQDQDPLKLKLLQRRLGQGVYIQETPRPIKALNSTELLIDISEDKDGYGKGIGSVTGWGTGWGIGNGGGFGRGYGNGCGHGCGHGYKEGFGWGDGDGFGRGCGNGFGYGGGLGDGEGLGKGSQSGDSEDNYGEYLRDNYGR